MGCSSLYRKKTVEIKNQISSRQLSLNASTFVRLTSNIYSLHYQEIQKLGSGGFADVMLCFHRPTKTQRAVKIVHKVGLSDSQRSQSSLLKEFDILRNLDHPNILRCYEIFEDSRCYYISTEYCPGGDLFTEISKMKKFSESQAADIMYQILSALVYCHERGIIHRDLKPENILLLEKGDLLSLKVADFGSSVLTTNNRKVAGCFGSAYYLAPEVINNLYDEKCDIWSLGIIMYILLTGKAPYPGKNCEAIIASIQAQPFIVTPAKTQLISSHAEELLKHLLKIKPTKRCSAKSAITHPWIVSHRERILVDAEVALQSLKEFNSFSKLQEAVNIFIATQIISHEDIKYFKKSFQKIDQNGDGKLTKQELLSEYSKFMSIEEAHKVANEVISKLDQDKDGQIDYTEFLVSCSQIQLHTSLENLEAAFNVFDIDGSGAITVEEIKAILSDGQSYDESIWKNILEEADTNKDGCIDLKEFIGLMNSNRSKMSRLINRNTSA